MKQFWRITYELLLLFFCISCIDENMSETEDVILVGSKLPNFKVEMNDGTVVTGQDLRDTTSLIMFFHTGCPDCRKALPCVQRMYNEYASRGVAFVLISREEEEASIVTYWEEQGLDMPYSAQSDRKVYELFANRRVPRIYISVPGGTVRYIFTDDPVPDVADLAKALEQTLFLSK